MITGIEEALRAEMAARAETARLKPDFAAAVERGIERDRVRRRVAGGSALALLVTVFVAASVILHGGSSTPTPANPPTDFSRFPLLEIPTRGSLAHDGAFVADAARIGRADLNKAVAGYGPLDPASFRLLYAGDDGAARYVVVAGIFTDPHATRAQPSSATSIYDVLIGPSGAPAAALQSQACPGSSQGERAFALIGESAGPGRPTPLIVLGPTEMTDIQYSSGISLDKTLRPHRVGVPMKTVDGAAIGEIPGTTSAFAAYAGSSGENLDTISTFAAYGYAQQTAFKATLDGHTTYDIESAGQTPPWVSKALTSDPALVAAHQGIKDLLIQKASNAGMKLESRDALVLSTGMTLDNLALAAHVTIADVHVSVAWIGPENPGTGTVVLDVTVPGLPAIQAFIDGTVGNADKGGDMPSPLIRIAPSPNAGPVPTTRAQFAGGVRFGNDAIQAPGLVW